MRKTIRYIILVLSAALLLHACASLRQGRQLANLELGITSSGVNFTKENNWVPDLPTKDLMELEKDSVIYTNFEGREVMVMRAQLDDEGEMVATDVLDAAVITSTSRHLAERNGKVDIAFEIKVPESIRNDLWQLRFFPTMRVDSVSKKLEPLYITGLQYNIKRMRGFEQYAKWLGKVATDSTDLIDMHQLEVFIQRNLPDLYRYKNDTSYVSDEVFISHYGVTEQQAIQHYMKTFANFRNKIRKKVADKKYNSYVKPQLSGGELRLDTVMRSGTGTFIYNYVQTVDAMPGLRKIEIFTDGEIWQQEEPLYKMAGGNPLVFYISSLTSLVDHSEKYKTVIIERRMEDNASYLIAFNQGKSELDSGLQDNLSQISSIKSKLRSLAENQTYDLDSVIVTASCSPEGSFDHNAGLSERRGQSVVEYFDTYIKNVMDSIATEEGIFYDEFGNRVYKERPAVRITSHTNPENWEMLDKLVYETDILSEDEIRSYDKIARKLYKKPDEREAALKREKYYGRLLSDVYPKLRTVQFDFHLHRKGMVKDTVHTTVLDSLYMHGVQLIEDRQYEEAIKILAPYKDFNAAVAYMSLDRNLSAMEILKNLKRTDVVNYMMAILHSRMGNDRKAIDCYLRACEQNRNMINRGILDPEISALIKKYGLDSITAEEDEFDYSF